MVQARNFVMQPETKPWLLPSLSRFGVYPKRPGLIVHILAEAAALMYGLQMD